MGVTKAKLEVKKTSNGAKQITFHYEKNNIPKHRILTQNAEKEKVDYSLDGKDCVFETEGNKIVKLTVDDQIIFNIKGQGPVAAPPSTHHHGAGHHVGGHASKPVGPSNAPYNFIPLNSTVVPSEHETWEEIPGFNQYKEGKLTGTVEIEIETKTPLYIRDTKTTDMQEDQQPESFFAPDGTPKIPGSSLKGLVRTMVEIASYSKFSFVDDKKLYFRNIGDNFFKNKMIRNDANGTHNLAKAGILREENGEYYIYPSKKINGTQYYRTDYNHNSRNLDANGNINPSEFTFQAIYFKPTNPRKQTERHKIPPKYALNYAFVNQISENPGNNFVKGYLVSSGNFSTKKHMHWIINEPGNEKKQLPKDVVENYEKDEQRDERSNLFQQLKNHQQGVPCFYLENGQAIKAFGHTGIFRLPYEKSIEDHIPNKADNTLDITEAMFGDTEHIMGRVSFEDANFTGDKNHALEEPISPKILSSPKPTTFQHYLEQPMGKNTPKDHLNNWNDNANIRGHKMYWHRENPNWSEGEAIRDRNDTQHTIVTPVKKGTTFKGTIRFENLTEVELGALLFVLELKENLYHKIGMAKPLGLGSIKIKPTLKLNDRHSETGRYAILFSNNHWKTAENQEQNQKKYIEKFEKYVLDKLGITTNFLWETERLKELEALLDFTKTSNANWNRKTEYLPLAEFKNRKVLPKPSEV